MPLATTQFPTQGSQADINAPLDDFSTVTGLVAVATKPYSSSRPLKAANAHQLSVAYKCTHRRSADRHRTSCGGH